mgnify:CR=1 FL=1
MNKVKEENKMLIMLAFFSISVGLWGNFRHFGYKIIILQ